MRRFADRRWPVRLILVGIVFVLVLPGLLFSSVLLARFAASEREQSRAEALAAATRTADALDRELGALVIALRVLSNSIALRNGDLAAFDEQARTVASTIGQNVVLTDIAGQQLVNTRRPFGSALPVSNSNEGHRRLVETHTVAVTDLFEDAIAQRPLVALLVPVLRGDALALVLSVSLEPAFVSTLLENQSLPAGWVASVADGKGLVFARNRDADRFMGQPATADFRANAIGSRAVWTGTTLEGTAVLAAAAKIRLADWHVGVGVPVSVVDAPLLDSLVTLVVGGFLTLALGCALAWQLARSVSAPLQRLAFAGQVVGLGGPVAHVRSRIAEVDAVSAALIRATSDLRGRAEALAAERARLAAIIETVPVGLLIADATSASIVAATGQLDRITRRPLRPGPLTEHYREWVAFHADGRAVEPEEYPLARALAGEDHAELQFHYRRHDGSLLWVQCVGAPIRSAGGPVSGAVIALLDIDEVVRAREEKARWAESLEGKVAARTAELEAVNQMLRDEIGARAKAEGQLRQAQKMEAVGRLTGGIAHDFNNLLTVIVGSIDLLRRRSPDARSTRLLDNAMEGATRAATLTARLLAFSRQQPLEPQPLDVNRLVAGMSDLLHRTLGETIHVETVLAGGLWPARADPNQLENALLNLAVNARDAIFEASPAGGKLTIETGNAFLAENYAAQHAGVRAGEYVMIAATDTGPGMAPEVLSRVFEPFFTTKPQGQGTGLGLSQVHGFINQSGGHVGIYTEPGHGTTVKLYLPRDVGQGGPQPATAAASPQAADPTGETILVVEDEPGVRRFTLEALHELGYVVLEADGAAAALRLLDAHPETTLLFTDVVMAGVSGRELAEEVGRRRPDLPVLFTTGYTRTAIVHNGQLDAGVDLIGKPFTVADLAAKVREVLDRQR